MRGISLVAQVVAQRAHPLVGRLACFMQNWAVVTQDQCVLQTITGFWIEFLREPFQDRPPNNPHLSSNEQELIHMEVESMLSKGPVMKLHPSESQEGFYSTLFPVPKRMGEQDQSSIWRDSKNSSLPDRGHSYCERLAKRERLANQGWSEGCVFHGSDPWDRQKIPLLLGKSKLLPIHLLPLWSIMCPLSLY